MSSLWAAFFSTLLHFTQARTLWTTAELVARYGGSEEFIGKEMARLGFAKRSIRQRLRDRSLSKKRAVYCVRPMPDFATATPSQLRSWLGRELYVEATQIAAAAVARMTQIVAEHAAR